MEVGGVPTTDKVLWAQDEALVGTLMLVEHAGAAWARDWFGRIYAYVEENFRLKPHGYPGWILKSDREVSFEPSVSRKGNYHHPRQLMLNVLALDRMIARLSG
jgi:hypothetical protein